MSNFLGESSEMHTRSHILGTSELIAREGVDLHKSMNFRAPEVGASVFLVLQEKGIWRDEWVEAENKYFFTGHSSTTVSGGKQEHQIAMYESGRLSDNGKFVIAAQAYKDKNTPDPLQIQIYEKIDSGVWYDKGLFELIDAIESRINGSGVYRFVLSPLQGGLSPDEKLERMIPASSKAGAWKRYYGRCHVCGDEIDLCFLQIENEVRLSCRKHGGYATRGFL